MKKKSILFLLSVCVLGKVFAFDYDVLDFLPQMLPVEGETFSLSSTEVTQELYEEVMGINPSKFKTKDRPVEMVSWYDAIVFCNKLSERKGFTPCYSFMGTTDVSQWGETPTSRNSADWSSLTCDFSANGFRLPTKDEWLLGAAGGAQNTYSGSNIAAGVAWYKTNSDKTTHPVATKQPNAYGFYDMSGNVWEWCWDKMGSYRIDMGGSYYDDVKFCNIDGRTCTILPETKTSSLGIRLCQSQ